MSNVTLEPFEWVEIDQDLCTLTYSTSPCTASLDTGATECFNTLTSCQDQANYNRGTLTLKFCKSQAFLPDDGYYIPSLVSASLSAGSINPVGANKNSSSLGTRGGISVEFQDHPHTDKFVDPYLANRVSRDAGYIATERGTFWTKWRARNRYFVGREIRHCSGFISNGTVVDVTTRTYFITDFEGPDASGRVSFAGKDILSKVASDKAKSHPASTGKLLNNITDSDTSITLDPFGIGSDYPASGSVRIGSELCTFTRSGDVLTVVRARYNTKAATANAGSIVQLCLEYDAMAPMAILEDLLVNGAGIPSTYLDLAQWATEQTDYMPRLYSALITEPTGVLDLIAEMAQQMYFYTVWDERASKLKVRAIRPAIGDTIYDLDDFANLLGDSVQIRDLTDQVITQVWVYYGIINPAASATDEKNYAVREIILTNEGIADKNGSETIKKIFCRWISSTNGAAAIELGEKILSRYGTAPRQATFSLAEKDSAVWLGDFVRLNHRLSVDMTGAPIALNMQVMSAQQSRQGVLFNYICQEFIYERPVDPNHRLIVIAADQVNINLRDLHDSLYAAPVGGETIRALVRTGVAIGGRTAEDIETYSGDLGGIPFIGGGESDVLLSPLANRDVSSRAFYAAGATYDGGTSANDMWVVPVATSFDTGTWPAGVKLILNVEAGAFVIGEGGYVGLHNNPNAYASDGGHAMRIQYPISINNLGTISGGGAGGFLFNAAWGGAGAGYRSIATDMTDDMVNPVIFGGSAYIARQVSPGSRTIGGSGAIVSYVGTGFGNFNNEGQSGGNLATSTYPFTPSFGGRAGNAVIEGASLITWINKGDVRGAEVA